MLMLSYTETKEKYANLNWQGQKFKLYLNKRPLKAVLEKWPLLNYLAVVDDGGNVLYPFQNGFKTTPLKDNLLEIMPHTSFIGRDYCGAIIQQPAVIFRNGETGRQNEHHSLMEIALSWRVKGSAEIKRYFIKKESFVAEKRFSI